MPCNNLQYHPIKAVATALNPLFLIKPNVPFTTRTQTRVDHLLQVTLFLNPIKTEHNGSASERDTPLSFSLNLYFKTETKHQPFSSKSETRDACLAPHFFTRKHPRSIFRLEPQTKNEKKLRRLPSYLLVLRTRNTPHTRA